MTNSEKEFDQFLEELQAEIDHKVQEDFSAYALGLANNLHHQGKIVTSANIVIHEWQGPCGDSVKWFLEITDKTITKARFLTNGCTTADIASEQTSRLIEGRTISDARALTPADVIDSLIKFPPSSHHCAELAIRSLNYALDKWGPN